MLHSMCIKTVRMNICMFIYMLLKCVYVCGGGGDKSSELTLLKIAQLLRDN